MSELYGLALFAYDREVDFIWHFERECHGSPLILEARPYVEPTMEQVVARRAVREAFA